MIGWDEVIREYCTRPNRRVGKRVTNKIQWNPVNNYPGVRIERAVRENVRNTCFIDIKTKADSFTNQGSVEVCRKEVNRGGGLGMEIPCVYIFDDAWKHAWIYLNNY